MSNPLPPLSEAEYQELRDSIQAVGIQVPIIVGVKGEIIDGEHRVRACRELGITDIPRLVRTFASEAERTAFIIQVNLARRHLSPEQTGEVRQKQHELARQLREEGRTQQEVATMLGVSQQAVDKWERESNTTGCNAFEPPDARVVVPRNAWPRIAARVAAKEPQEQIASAYHVTPQRIGQIAQSGGA